MHCACRSGAPAGMHPTRSLSTCASNTSAQRSLISCNAVLWQLWRGARHDARFATSAVAETAKLGSPNTHTDTLARLESILGASCNLKTFFWSILVLLLVGTNHAKNSVYCASPACNMQPAHSRFAGDDLQAKTACG